MQMGQANSHDGYHRPRKEYNSIATTEHDEVHTMAKFGDPKKIRAMAATDYHSLNMKDSVSISNVG